ncbi:MAG: GTP-binding protein [Candidatus Heimdallarchaeota archaeon]|nr:GTP-binding protein [Candidatus Heimdallarchaeota archaeon]
MTEEVSDFIFKIIAVGDASVGKTSLTQRYATSRFLDDYRMTLGMNLITKNLTLETKRIQLAIWDTGGQAAFEPLIPMYYRGALGALVVYDITNEKTFKSVEKWISDIKQHCDEIPIVIIGNKKDLGDNIAISTEKGEKLFNSIRDKWSKSVAFYEASAKEDLGVSDAFISLAESILETIDEDEEDDLVFEGLI